MSADASSGMIQTVKGLIEPDQLGMTLPHEHLYIQIWQPPDRNDYAGQLEDDDILSDELLQFKNLVLLCYEI